MYQIQVQIWLYGEKTFGVVEKKRSLSSAAARMDPISREIHSTSNLTAV
jgi:hypothetical protein